MMLNLKLSPISDKVYNYVPLGVLLTFILSTELTYVLSLTFSDLFYMDADYDSFISLLAEEHLVQLALILFLFLTMPFLIVALVLLIALIGAIVLTVSNNTDFRHQEVSEQLRASRLSIRSLP
jgi:NADH-quinone oxidoreductase subunit J